MHKDIQNTGRLHSKPMHAMSTLPTWTTYDDHVPNELSVQPTLKQFVLGFTVHLIFSQYTHFHLFEHELFQSMHLSYRLAIFNATLQPVFSSDEL